jgi:RHS repeat-associated protein
MVANYEYDPYGNQTNVAGTYEQPFRFSGKYHDAETGLGYWGYRYYNPVLGRWINRDPLGEPGGLNLYAYCGNGPAGRIDALGLSGDETPIGCHTICQDDGAFLGCVQDLCGPEYDLCIQARDDARYAAEEALFKWFQRRLELCGDGRWCRIAVWTHWTLEHTMIQLDWTEGRLRCELEYGACVFGCDVGSRTTRDGDVDCPPGQSKRGTRGCSDQLLLEWQLM